MSACVRARRRLCVFDEVVGLPRLAFSAIDGRVSEEGGSVSLGVMRESILSLALVCTGPVSSFM